MMRSLFAVASCIVLLNAPALGQPAMQAVEENTFRVGVSPQSFANVNRNDGEAAVRVWASSVAREMGLDVQWDVVLFDSAATFKRAVQDEQIDAMQMLTHEFVDLGVSPAAVYLQTYSGGAAVRYVLLAGSDADLRDISAVSGGEVLLYQGLRMELALQWIDTLFAHRDGNIAAPRVRTTDNASKAILEVFFGQSRLSVVSREAFELAVELNPQLRRDLHILAESPPLITTLFFFHPDWDRQERASVEDAVRNLHKTTAGKQVLLVFQGERMEEQPVSVLDDTLGFLRSHRRIRGEVMR